MRPIRVAKAQHELAAAATYYREPVPVAEPLRTTGRRLPVRWVGRVIQPKHQQQRGNLAGTPGGIVPA